MIKMKYKGKVVTGYWFMLGDSRWFLLSPKSTRETGREAIPEDEIEEA